MWGIMAWSPLFPGGETELLYNSIVDLDIVHLDCVGNPSGKLTTLRNTIIDGNRDDPLEAGTSGKSNSKVCPDNY
jgi:hypothetical protein